MSETLFDILENIGYKVDVANDGYNAIKLISKHDYTIVLMDIKMPGINGVETFKEIKQIRPSTKVIMMTAYSVDNLVKEALKEGAYGIIYKPLNIDNLLHFFKKLEKDINILIVDDDPNFCETLKDALEEVKYKIAVSNNGQQAIKYIKENEVNIVFIDIKIPVLNGLEIYLAIKKINPKVTGIMITGYKYDEVANLVEEALKNDLYTCLYKPFDKGKVIALIEEICRKHFKNL